MKHAPMAAALTLSALFATAQDAAAQDTPKPRLSPLEISSQVPS